MPELPEVEVTRRRLWPHVRERQISRVLTTAPSYFFLTSPQVLKRRLCHRSFVQLERVGKYLVATLDNNWRLVLHLGMTGQLFSEAASSPRLLRRTVSSAVDSTGSFTPDQHTHLQLRFADGGPAVYFRDARKFGKVRLLKPGETEPRLEKLGPDALTIAPAHLVERSRKRRTPVKGFLLDQKVLAGVGNIYADEALFRAGIHPERPANAVTDAEYTALAGHIIAVLQRSIETGGSSISDYISPDGDDGTFQDERKVYGLEGSPCQSCQTSIERITLAGRSSHFCPNCQA